MFAAMSCLSIEFTSNTYAVVVRAMFNAQTIYMCVVLNSVHDQSETSSKYNGIVCFVYG